MVAFNSMIYRLYQIPQSEDVFETEWNTKSILLK